MTNRKTALFGLLLALRTEKSGEKPGLIESHSCRAACLGTDLLSARLDGCCGGWAAWPCSDDGRGARGLPWRLENVEALVHNAYGKSPTAAMRGPGARERARDVLIRLGWAEPIISARVSPDEIISRMRSAIAAAGLDPR